jgi:hypothetical protein
VACRIDRCSTLSRLADRARHLDGAVAQPGGVYSGGTTIAAPHRRSHRRRVRRVAQSGRVWRAGNVAAFLNPICGWRCGRRSDDANSRACATTSSVIGERWWARRVGTFACRTSEFPVQLHQNRQCERSEANPDCHRGSILDFFAALAMTGAELAPPANHHHQQKTRRFRRVFQFDLPYAITPAAAAPGRDPDRVAGATCRPAARPRRAAWSARARIRGSASCP